ncbi:hypothetical protein [Paraherbaspirillum soli]|uniref:Uncharacterized protein n=1 Tax=Paraherbaspirillum soli TaxID=631222 RepID=A0ABW0M9N4_9BURK
MPSDQEIGKKEAETSELIPFFQAYKWVTSERLSLTLPATENPDFICIRADGRPVGVELTKVTRDKGVRFWEHILHGKEEIDPFEAQELILHLIEKKESARIKRYSARVRDCILVLQLIDGSLEQLKFALEDHQEDFAAHGFSEIWLADYSGLQAFGDIELFGLFPDRWWGYHERPWPDRKPYG